MIAKSDLIILALSTTFLVAGIVRWQHNTSVVPVVTIPASSQGPGVKAESTQDQEFAPVVTRLPARADDASSPSLASRTTTPIEPEVVEVVEVTEVAEAVQAEPEAQAATVATSESTSPVSDPSPELLGTYTVVPGDYLGWIAEEFGTTVETLKELNGLESNNIQIGQKIKYPLPD